MPYQAVRRVLPHEYSKYCSHLKLLDTESKILRFGNAFNDSAIDTICDRFEANADQHILFAIENDQLEFIAVGHIALTDGMELAFSVLKEYQAQGLGNLLMKRCIMYCRTHGILKGCMICLSTNSVIKHLCKKYGIHIQTQDGDTLADIELDHPSLATYVEEAAVNNLGNIDYLSKRLTKPWSIFA